MTLYEMEFKETRALATYKYRKYNIYAYQQDFGDNIHYTFWYGDKDNEYISSIHTLIEAQLKIDECFILKFKTDLEPLKGIKYKDGSYHGDFIYGDNKFLSNF